MTKAGGEHRASQIARGEGQGHDPQTAPEGSLITDEQGKVQEGKGGKGTTTVQQGGGPAQGLPPLGAP